MKFLLTMVSIVLVAAIGPAMGATYVSPAGMGGAPNLPLTSPVSLGHLKTLTTIPEADNLISHYPSLQALKGFDFDRPNLDILGAMGRWLPRDFDTRLAAVTRNPGQTNMLSIVQRMQTAYDKAAEEAERAVRAQAQEVGEALSRGEVGEQEIRQTADRLRPLAFFGPQVMKHIAILDKTAADLLAADAQAAQEEAVETARKFEPRRFWFDQPRLNLSFDLIPHGPSNQPKVQNFNLEYDPRGLRRMHLLRRTFGPKPLHLSDRHVHATDEFSMDGEFVEMGIEFKAPSGKEGEGPVLSISKKGEVSLFPMEPQGLKGVWQGLITDFQNWRRQKLARTGIWSTIKEDLSLSLVSATLEKPLVPGDFGAEIRDGKLFVPKALSGLLAPFPNVDTVKFVSLLHEQTTFFALTLHWNFPQILHAQSLLIEQLRGHIPDRVLTPPTAAKRVHGAWAPRRPPPPGKD